MMNRKDIEILIMWLIGALLVSTIVGPVLGAYSKSIMDISNSSVPFGMTKGDFVFRMVFVSFISNSLVNIVIAFWVFKTTTSKKLLWVAFSLLAGWWALPLFIYYQYFTVGHNQSLQQKTAE
jgi:hypothetical protein